MALARFKGFLKRNHKSKDPDAYFDSEDRLGILEARRVAEIYKLDSLTRAHLKSKFRERLRVEERQRDEQQKSLASERLRRETEYIEQRMHRDAFHRMCNEWSGRHMPGVPVNSQAEAQQGDDGDGSSEPQSDYKRDTNEGAWYLDEEYLVCECGCGRRVRSREAAPGGARQESKGHEGRGGDSRPQGRSDTDAGGGNRAYDSPPVYSVLPRTVPPQRPPKIIISPPGPFTGAYVGLGGVPGWQPRQHHEAHTSAGIHIAELAELENSTTEFYQLPGNVPGFFRLPPQRHKGIMQETPTGQQERAGRSDPCSTSSGCINVERRGFGLRMEANSERANA